MSDFVQKNADLLHGSPFFSVLKFSVPMIIGDFCQQLYNAVDSMIVGQCVGKSALAALGIAGPIYSMVLFFLVGIAMGVGVVISQHFGARNLTRLKRAAATGLVAGSLVSLLVAVGSIALSRPFLRWMNTPQELLDPTDTYLKIVYIGLFFSYVYNYYCFAIRAVGNVTVPLLFLIVSVIVNALLDLLFVPALGMGVAGAALATVLAQGLSAVLCIVYTQKRVSNLRLGWRELRIDRTELGAVTSYGLSMSLQQVFVYVGRISVQGLVNTYDVNTIAGVNAATRTDALLQTPARGYTNALTTYCAQNWGAGNFERIRRGYLASWIGVLAYTVIGTLLGILLARPLTAMFVDGGEVEVIAVGEQFVRVMATGYLFMCIIVQSQSFMKGIGLLKCFFASTAISILFRIGFSYLFEHIWGLQGMYWAVPASWVIGGTYGIIVSAIGYRVRCNPARMCKREHAQENVENPQNLTE